MQGYILTYSGLKIEKFGSSGFPSLMNHFTLSTKNTPQPISGCVLVRICGGWGGGGEEGWKITERGRERRKIKKEKERRKERKEEGNKSPLFFSQ